MNKSYLSRSIIHDAISVGLDALADKHMPTDNSAAIINIELHTRFSSTHSRSTTRTIGLTYENELDSGIFRQMRHNLSVRSIKLAPGTDLLLSDWNMFGKIFKVHNGSDQPRTFTFSTYKPTIHSIKVVKGEKDGKTYDSYNWGWYILNTKTLPFIAVVILIITVIIITSIKGKKQKQTNTETDTAPATQTETN